MVAIHAVAVHTDDPDLAALRRPVLRPVPSLPASSRDLPPTSSALRALAVVALLAVLVSVGVLGAFLGRVMDAERGISRSTAVYSTE